MNPLADHDQQIAPTDGADRADHDAHAHAPTATPPRRGWARLANRRVAVAVGFVLIACITAGALIALALTQERPRWWASVDLTDPATISTAAAVENGVATALTQVRPRAASIGSPDSGSAPQPDTWKVFVTTEQANAWLGVRLRPWLKDQAEQGRAAFRWPPELREVQVRFSNGLLHVGARVARTGPAGGVTDKERTLAAAIRPEFKADGSLWMTAQSVSIGRLTLPAAWVLPRGADGSTVHQPRTASSAPGVGSGGPSGADELATELAAMPEATKVLAAFNGAGPVLARPVVKLADGRRVRIVGMEAEEGRVVIECRTEDRAAPAR